MSRDVRRARTVSPGWVATSVATCGARLRDLVAVGRPMFWPVSLSPFLLGLTLATGEILPPREHWVRSAVAGLVIGPLIWFTVLAVNDAYDVEGDRLNERKSGTPLTRGRLTPYAVLTISRWAGGLSVLAGFLVGFEFALGTAAVVILGWAYSAPPVRLKTRLLCDIGVNAFVVGVVGQLGGWAIVRPVAEFPWVNAGLGFLVGAALYAPTLVIDLESDRQVGYTTTAVIIGRRATYWLGGSCFGTACALTVVLSFLDVLFTRDLLGFQAAAALVQLVVYAVLMRRPSFSRIAVVSVLFVLNGIVFLLGYVAH